MRSTIHVVTPAHFQAWLKSQRTAAGAGAADQRRAAGGSGGIMSAEHASGDVATGRPLMAAKLRAPGFYRAAW